MGVYRTLQPVVHILELRLGLDATYPRTNMPSGDISQYGHDLCTLYARNMAPCQRRTDRRITLYSGKFWLDDVV